MKNKKSKVWERGSIELMEEAFHLLRKTSIKTWVCFYVGALPFVLSSVYFFFYMNSFINPERYIFTASLLMSALYLWMKVWHAAFSTRLHEELTNAGHSSWSVGRIIKVFFIQTILQVTSLIVLPLAVVIMLPFGWCYAFYQNLSLIGNGDLSGLREVAREAKAQSLMCPKENHMFIWLLSPYLFILSIICIVGSIYAVEAIGHGLVNVSAYAVIVIVQLIAVIALIGSPIALIVAINITLLLFLLPKCLHMFLGVETVFSLSGHHVFSSVFLAVVCGITFLIMEPIIKAVYVLRCFYGKSIVTGEDILIRLKSSSGRIVSVLLLMALIFPLATNSLHGDVPEDGEVAYVSVSPQDVKNAINETMQGPRFEWRFPGDKIEGNEYGIMSSFLKMLSEYLEGFGSWIGDAMEWVFELVGKIFKNWFDFDSNDAGKKNEQINWNEVMMPFMYAASAIIVICLCILFYRYRLKVKSRIVVDVEMAKVVPDLMDESVTADQLQDSEWDEMGKELLQQGNFRLALRAYYLGTIACLGACDLLRIRASKSNYDYIRELYRRSGKNPYLDDLFRENVNAFERSWYGYHEVTEYILDDFEKRRTSIKQAAQAL